MSIRIVAVAVAGAAEAALVEVEVVLATVAVVDNFETGIAKNEGGRRPRATMDQYSLHACLTAWQYDWHPWKSEHGKIFP